MIDFKGIKACTCQFTKAVLIGCLDSVEWNGGMEYWNGIVERWNEHAHDSIDKNVVCS